MYKIEDLKNGMYTGFIDDKIDSFEEYQPSLLINDKNREVKVLTSIIEELSSCTEFYFSVAFITNGGVASLINTLKDLEERNIKGKIVTSQYQNFTQPEALKRLIELSNVEVRIATKGNFHAKGYIFKKHEHYRVIIGSSNLTQNALSYNKEWNLKVSASGNGGTLKRIIDEFNENFEAAEIVTEEWINEYKEIYQSERQKRVSIKDQMEDIQVEMIKPNKMQEEALEALEKLRSEKKEKALVISATGTGKTYLSAFDVKKFKPKRFLFVVHRENIARAARKSYKRILGNNIEMGVLSGNSKNFDASYLFSTIQTLHKDEILERFKPDHFDYIVIDEVHRSGSKSYEKILNYFEPRFLLGMSATPERTDGYDIYKTFDYNIAYEIRLKRALQEDILSPFHYYGISEIEVDGVVLDDKTDFNKLVSDERVERIIEKAKFYGFDNGRVKGLVFCSSIKEAKDLSNKFNQRGYKTISLDGSSSEKEREEAIQRLERNEQIEDYLDYIFTVDIFNEGVDIPSVNQIIMLRPTQSSIVFVQQLGRGLRKSNGKEYLVVIDFIGNYANNFLIPIALYGDKSYNKDNLRKLMNSGSSTIPGVSTVNFDSITKDRIFKSIDNTNMATKKALVEEYKLLKYKLGKIPTMMDFILHGSRDPIAFIDYSKSYYNFISDIENMRDELSLEEKSHLEFYSKELGGAKRIEDIIMLEMLIKHECFSISEFEEIINENYGFYPSEQTIESCIRQLNCQFLKEKDQKKYKQINTLSIEGTDISINEELKDKLNNKYFKDYLIDLLEYCRDKFNKAYSKENYNKGFLFYGKYSRKDVCKILNWESDDSSTVYGYRIKYNTCPIFVTYHKKDDISESTKYEDGFVNKHQFSWMTRSGINLDSSEVKAIKNYSSTGLRILLFVKKSDGEGGDFYYMGDVEPTDYKQTTIKDNNEKEKNIVNINYKLNREVEDKLYNYLIN